MQSTMTILVIEDDTRIANFITMALKAKGYRSLVAKNGKMGQLSFCTENPDIIILDLGLPDMDGIDLIREIREISKIPIIVVSARGQETDKITALDAGANDYVTKPFSMGELLARIRVMERWIDRAVSPIQDSLFDYIDLTPEYSIFEIPVPEGWVGGSIKDINVRIRYHISILAIKKNENIMPMPKADYIFKEKDHMIVLGKPTDVLKLAAYVT